MKKTNTRCDALDNATDPRGMITDTIEEILHSLSTVIDHQLRAVSLDKSFPAELRAKIEEAADELCITMNRAEGLRDYLGKPGAERHLTASHIYSQHGHIDRMIIVHGSCRFDQ